MAIGIQYINDMEVLACGVIVEMKIGSIKGMIVAISIEFTSVIYKIKYYIGEEYKFVWCSPQEFRAVVDIKTKNIGFNKE